jgi:hypothetical protein
MKVNRKSTYAIELDGEREAGKLVAAIGDAMTALSELDKGNRGLYSLMVSRGTVDTLLALRSMLIGAIPDKEDNA